MDFVPTVFAARPMAGPRPCGRANLKGAIVRLLLSKGRSLRGTAVALLRCASRPPTSAQVSSGSRCCACAAPGAAAAPGPRGCHGDMPLAEASSPGHGHAACGPGPTCAPTMRQPRPLPGSMSAALCSLPTARLRLCPYAARLQRKERPATAPFSPQAHAAKSSRRRVRVPSRASIRLIYALI